VPSLWQRLYCTIGGYMSKTEIKKIVADTIKEMIEEEHIKVEIDAEGIYLAVYNDEEVDYNDFFSDLTN